MICNTYTIIRFWMVWIALKTRFLRFKSEIIFIEAVIALDERKMQKFDHKITKTFFLKFFIEIFNLRKNENELKRCFGNDENDGWVLKIVGHFSVESFFNGQMSFILFLLIRKKNASFSSIKLTYWKENRKKKRLPCRK